MPHVFVEKYQQHEERQASADHRNIREANLALAKRLGCATFTRFSPTFTEQRMHTQLWSAYAPLISSRLPSYTVTKDTTP